MTLRTVVLRKEKELRPLRSEVGIALDAKGNVILAKRANPGEEYMLEFAEEEVAMLRAVGNVTFTHNHPRGWTYPPHDPRHAGTSFSPEDILFACRAQLAEIRIVTPVATYSMKPPMESGWTADTWEREIRPLYEMVSPQVKSRLYASALRGEISPSEASMMLEHEVWTELAQLLGLRYNRVEE